jgi:hypothetical protein
MAATSEVEIMNSALIKVGAERIITPDDANNRARLCKEQYPKVRDALLRAHPWKFSTSYASLAVITPKPAEIFEYAYAYQLPSDCARIFKTNLDVNDEWQEIAGGMLVCNTSAVSIKYSKRITNVAQYDDSFCEVLAYALAMDIAYALTQSTAQVDKMERGFKDSLAQARSHSAQIGSVQRVISDDWLSARRRG